MISHGGNDRQKIGFQCSTFFVLLFAIPIVAGKLQNEPIDDCCCDVNTVTEANHKELNPILNKLVETLFFRYFKLDLFSDCPFWAADFLCGLGGCAVCECDEDEVPMYWTKQTTDRVSVQTPADFVDWKDKAENMWIAPWREEDSSYVNLQAYPESNTSYDGSMIWERIYRENCFTGNLNSMCLEERVFYRLISGMHTSISTHIARYYSSVETVDEKGNKKVEWKSNATLFEEKVGKYPERIENLYFAYLFLLRAVFNVSPQLKSYKFDTGHPEQDAEVAAYIDQLLKSNLLCSPNFDETVMFKDVSRESIRQQFKQHFRNISLIVNCVQCEKCKVYSKLQTLGLGTALKILLDGESKEASTLERNEIIALINTLRQFSNSIEAIQYFQSLKDNAQHNTIKYYILLVGSSACMIVVYVFVSNKRKWKTKDT